MLLAGVLTASAAPETSTTRAQPTHTISEISARDLSAMGIQIVDDYGAFLTAELSSAQIGLIRARGGLVDPLPTGVKRGLYEITDQVPDALRSPTAAHWVVEYRGPIKAEWLGELQTLGDMRQYLPHYAYIVELDAPNAQVLSTKPYVRSLTPYHAAFKLAPDLPDSASRVAIQTYPGADIASLVSALSMEGVDVGHVVDNPPHVVLHGTASRDALARVAHRDEVLWIEAAATSASLGMDKASNVTQSGALNVSSIHAQGVDGSTQVGMTCDGTMWPQDFSHPGHNLNRPGHETVADIDPLNSDVGLVEFNAHLLTSPEPLPAHRKVVRWYAPIENGALRGDPVPPAAASSSGHHATRVAGVMLGDKDLNEVRDRFDGIAYRAKLAMCDIEIAGQWQLLNDSWNGYAPAYGAGASVAAVTLGGFPSRNDYNLRAHSEDSIAWNNRNFTVAMFMDNDGLSSAMTWEATAKNLISVGATENKPVSKLSEQSDGNEEKVASFSNRGPTLDGRFKPNVVAPGHCVVSPLDISPGYSCVSGTSYSTPLVAGSALLVRDYFAKGYYPTGAANTANLRTNMSSALLRAILQASGHDMQNLADNATYPNAEQGWGRVSLDQALYFQGETKKLLVLDETEVPEFTSSGANFARQFRVHSSGEVRVMLTWTDHPGAVLGNATNVSPLANDLNLRVGGPPPLPGGTNTTYIGNAFVGNETQEGKGFPADARNVEEAVYICHRGVPPLAPPVCQVPTGIYTVRVLSGNIVEPVGAPRQNFALVITGDVSWV